MRFIDLLIVMIIALGLSIIHDQNARIQALTQQPAAQDATTLRTAFSLPSEGLCPGTRVKVLVLRSDATSDIVYGKLLCVDIATMEEAR